MMRVDKATNIAEGRYANKKPNEPNKDKKGIPYQQRQYDNLNQFYSNIWKEIKKWL